MPKLSLISAMTTSIKGIWKLIVIVDNFFLQTNHQSKIEYRKAEISHNLLKIMLMTLMMVIAKIIIGLLMTIIVIVVTYLH